jgi:3-methylfumaryl-CoA hydratase
MRQVEPVLTTDIEMENRYTEWLGRTEHATDLITAGPLQGLAATLNCDDVNFYGGVPVPPGWHWLYFLPFAQQRAIGEDGDPVREGFLPPVDLPRRMWVGGRLNFFAQIYVGDCVERISTITTVREKAGRSGPLAFVTIEHQLRRVHGELLIREEQEIVYRDAARPSNDNGATRPTASSPGQDRSATRWPHHVRPSPSLLFRYFTLTFNSNRIHYDRHYATKVGAPSLVIHGPLQATLLLELVRRELPQL